MSTCCRVFILVLVVFICLLGCQSTSSELQLTKLVTTAPQSMSLFNIEPNGTQNVAMNSGHLNLISSGETANTRVYSKPEEYIYSQNTLPATFGEGRGELPNIRFDFIIENKAKSSKSAAKIIPLKRHLILTQHPTWDYFIGVGDIVKQGDVYLAAMPFALVEKNQNCVHNGALLIELNEAGQAGQFYYQINSETCAYYQADMWGTGTAKLTQIDKFDAKVKYADGLAKPLQELQELSQSAPEIDLAKLKLQHLINKQDMTALGVIHQGQHYAAQCNTRAGLYPFCSQLVLPSYSMAKSIFASLVMMHLQHKYGDVFQQPINKWVKQCASEQNQANWQGVTFAHLLGMTTGNYDSNIHGVDEGALHTAKFFSVATNDQKLAYACGQFSRQQTPGKAFVYHTSDTYLLGAGLQAYWQAKKGKQADVFTDILLNKVFAQAKLSQVASETRRSQDKAAQPFAGYGLFLLPSDIAKLSKLLASNNKENNRDTHLFDDAEFNKIMQPNKAQSSATEFQNIRYANGFWLYNLKQSLQCKQDKFVPYMMGYGGLALVFLSADTQFYYVSDSAQYAWRDAAVELNKLTDICH